jgi:triosephosphate isomerase
MDRSIIGNWKSNGSLELNKIWFKDFQENIKDSAISSAAICPPYLYLDQVSNIINKANIIIGSQDIDISDGARTGSISIEACKDLGCQFSIIGHSERRTLFGETDLNVREKLLAAQDKKMSIVMCIGEPEEDYLSGNTKDYLFNQINKTIKNVDLAEDFTIAYEPIWAIGTGKLPKMHEINTIHKYIKDIVQSTSKNSMVPKVIYGGSVTSKNAEELFKEDCVDGALIGGASLNGKEFAKIANQFLNKGL